MNILLVLCDRKTDNPNSGHCILITVMSVIQILLVLHFSTVDVIIICEHCEHKFTQKHTYDNHIHYGICKINAERKLNPPSPKAM